LQWSSSLCDPHIFPETNVAVDARSLGPPWFGIFEKIGTVYIWYIFSESLFVILNKIICYIAKHEQKQ